MCSETACLSLKYWGILLLLHSSIHQIASMESASANDTIHECFRTFVNGTPACNFHISEDAEADIVVKCLRRGVLQVTGDYKDFNINCTQSYPLDFKFDGHKPTEAIHARAWGRLKNNSGGKFTSFHLTVKIQSISSLHDHYRNVFPHRVFNSQDAYSYSRTGKYIISGYHEREKLQAQFYIFFEENNSKHSFIRNNEVSLRLPDPNSSVLEDSNLVVPCRPTHSDDKVTLKRLKVQTKNGTMTKLNFTYDATTGFVVATLLGVAPYQDELTSLKFLCQIATNETVTDFIQFSGLKSGVAFGFDGLPDQSGVSINYQVTQLANGSYVTQPFCAFDDKDISNGISTFTSLGFENAMMYRLLRDFVLPAFSNQSYTVTTTTDALQNGEVLVQEKTRFLVANSYCGDTANYLADTVGVGLAGNYISLKYAQDFVKTKYDIYPIQAYIKIEVITEGEDSSTAVTTKSELYVNAEVTFRCYFSSFLYIPPVIWYTERRNGSVVEEKIDYDWKNNFFSYARIKLWEDVKSVLCAGTHWNTGALQNRSLPITLKDSSAPSFDAGQNSNQRFSVNAVNKILKCSARGTPMPAIYWQRNGKNITSSIHDREDHSAILEFSKVTKEDEGIYICIASNFASRKEKRFNIQVYTDANYGLIIRVPILVLLCLVVAISAWIYVAYFRKEQNGLSKSEIKDFYNGEGENEGSGSSAIQMKVDATSNEYVHDVAHLCAYNKECEIFVGRFQIDTTNVLGSGAYGMVVTGKLDGVPIAVKTVKKNADRSYLKALLSELKVMIFLGSHENLVGILGACTVNLNKGQVYIFVPLCELGSLDSYLTKNRHLFIIEADSTPVEINDGSSSRNPNCITMKNLYDWSLQIAQGMDYLSTKRVIHGDLAARNILLTLDRTAKITDFGLSRKLYQYAEYAKRQQEPLPWRHMALESLRDLKFSTKSDVWSYGVTLWEIFSLVQQVPYPDHSWTLEFVAELESGLRLGRPSLATDTDLYEGLMKDCWTSDPQLRPSFSHIQEQLREMSKF